MRNTAYCIFLFILALSVPLFSAAKETPRDAEAPPVGALKDISASNENGTLTVTVKTDRLMKPQTFRLENPSRLVVDFENAVNKVAFMQLPLNAPSAKQLRVSQFQRSNPRIARVVFDLEKEFGSHKITQNDTSVQVTLYPAKTAAAKTAEPVPAAAAPKTKTAKVASALNKPAGTPEKSAEPVKTAAPSSQPAAPKADVSLKK
ncbi:MAG: AMIN domain-containing protein, partial [Acidobacteria bacterium]|nr:AMIN domain-containing protein [Acidobacteriota bacterium]